MATTSQKAVLRKLVDDGKFADAFRESCDYHKVEATKSLYLDSLNRLYDMGIISFSQLSIMYLVF